MQKFLKRTSLVSATALFFFAAVIPLAAGYLISGGRVFEFTAAAVLTFLNAEAAYILAFSGQEGMFKIIISGLMFRLGILAAAAAVLILFFDARPVPLFGGFIGFYLIHQTLLLFLLRRKTAGHSENKLSEPD